jgi:Zn-dependent M16 (insulinase) family peptidase
MEQEKDKFSVIAEIYSQFTEENKEKLIKSAKTLLKVQKEDAEMITVAPVPQKEK